MEPVTCRYTDAWKCKLYTKEGTKNVVSTETCGLCMKAKEITKAIMMLEMANALYGEINQAIRTMNTYTYRLQRALEKLEAED